MIKVFSIHSLPIDEHENFLLIFEYHCIRHDIDAVDFAGVFTANVIYKYLTAINGCDWN